MKYRIDLSITVDVEASFLDVDPDRHLDDIEDLFCNLCHDTDDLILENINVWTEQEDY